MQIRGSKQRKYFMLSCAIATWMALPGIMYANTVQGEGVVYVTADRAHEEAKLNSQQVSIITKKDIEDKQAKSVEDIIFTESGVSRTVDSMGRVGVSIRGAEPRHTLILVDGQQVLGDLAKFSGAADEVMRLGTENVERIEVIQGSASAKYGSDAIGGVINIITKKATKKPRIQINAEGSRAKGGETGYGNSNFFMRADSGQMGKVRVAISGSKRDIMPVYATEARRNTGDRPEGDFKPNALRFYGDTSDIGFNGTYDINKNNSIEVRANRYTEDLIRDVKHSNSYFEPQQHFKRNSSRNTYNMIWNGKGGASDWKLEGNYSRINENDISLINYSGRSKYEGKNELRYIDDVDHRQRDFRFSANSAINDNHTLSWGAAYTKETGSGSRLKSSPITKTRYIDPWDYDKNLLVDGVDRLERKQGDTSLRIYSHIHDFKFKGDANGLPIWDKDYEYYGANDSSQVPPITYEYYREHNLEKADYISDYYNNLTAYGVTDEKYNDIKRFEAELKAQNPHINGSSLYKKYFDQGESIDPKQRELAPSYNGTKFLENYRERDQRITEGEGSITKKNYFLSDAWQLNKNLLLQPTLRYDQSSLFGNHLSWNMGATYNVGSNPHRRLKANIGTGYSEPGMGELWYNWQMFASNPVAQGVARMGWYWAGNPNLKPETSKNYDISFEGEGEKDYARVGLFHNRIHNYMSVYFTGALQDWAPQLPLDQKWLRAPDLIYSFKNIGKAQITGFQLEWRHKIDKHWSTRFGWTRLQALNKSDPTMPRHLLDRPTNKIDIGITYETKKWNAQIWTDYYHRMLDSNTQKNRSNYWISGIDSDSAIYNVSNDYEEKSFGIWNAMFQRRFDKDSLIYVGINNIFNHHDDDRATQSRVYRFGVNLKFGSDGHTKDKAPKKAALSTVDTTGVDLTTADGVGQSINESTTQEALRAMNGDKNGMNHNFLDRPFDTSKSEGVEVIGDYRARLMAHGGSEKPESVFAHGAFVDTAQYNMFDKKEHGLEQRIRVGVDARVGKNTNITVLGSASGRDGVDTNSTTMDSKGFNHQRLDNLDLTHRTNKWDFSVGRISEKMGVTGYWFNKEYDGIRATWTDERNQFRAGYGSFKRSTGISDSPYTHSRYATFYRPPTVDELLGVNVNGLVQTDNNDPLSVRIRTGKAGVKIYDPVTKEQLPAPDSPIANYEVYKDNPNLYFYEQLKAIYNEGYHKVKNSWGWETEEAIPGGKSDVEVSNEQALVLSRLQELVGKAYGDTEQFRDAYIPLEMPTSATILYDVEDNNGNVFTLRTRLRTSAGTYDSESHKELINSLKGKFSIKLTDPEPLKDPQAWVHNNTELIDNLNKIAESNAREEWAEYEKSDAFGSGWSAVDTFTLLPEDGKIEVSKIDSAFDSRDFKFKGVRRIVNNLNTYYKTFDVGAIDDILYRHNFVRGGANGRDYDMGKMSNMNLLVWSEIFRLLPQTEVGNAQPREALEKLVGKPILEKGLTLQRDVIPAIDKAVFAQYKTQINPRLGVQAWFLRSVSDKNHTFETGNYRTKMEKVSVLKGYEKNSWGGDDESKPIFEEREYEVQDFTNDTYTPNRLANIFAIGAQYQLGKNALLSFDYGQNRSDFGRYMNGHTMYDHVRGTADFTIRGRAQGGTPHFWAARLDIGQSNFSLPGSWNAFVDYKYFAHGSFFGGNGTGAVPDRYLDGVRSFTVGGGYVPRKDFLLEAFYTFDAKGIGQRDTLYGAENFKLGNYTRIQGTYKF